MKFNLTKSLSSRLAILLVFVLCFSTNINAQINVLWEARYTSAGVNTDVGKEIAIDASGNTYVTGTSLTNATNGYDIVTAKYDALGNQLWTTIFNGTGSSLDEAKGIEVDAGGNVYVTGSTTSTGPNTDYITIKYNAAGVQQWATPYNGTGGGFDIANDIAIDATGNTYVVGSSDAGANGSDFVTIQYNSAGVLQWATAYHNPGGALDEGTQIELDALNNVYVTGRSGSAASSLDIATVKYNNAGAQQWASRFNGVLNFDDVPDALHIDNLNNVYVAGATYGGLATENDYVTIKINNAGAQQWAQIIDGPLNDEDQAFDLLTDLNQNVYVTGRSMGAGGTAENMLTVKYDPLGNVLWQDTYDGPASGYDDAQQIRLGTSGALYITGYSAGLGTNNDYLTLKYDTSNGGILWEARFDGPASNNDQAFAMEIDASESIYVTGTSTDPTSGQDFSTIKWCQLSTTGGADIQICVGDTTPLSANAPGATGYTWAPSTGLNNSGIANPLAYPTTTTTYTVSATNALGCVDVDTVVITVNPLPITNITSSGPTSFCVGDSVILSTASVNSYSWTPNGDTTQSVTVFSSGTFTVSVIDSNGCLNSSADEVVTVYNLPNVSVGSDINLCNGDSIQLNATGASTYLWNTQSTLTDSTISSPFAYPSIATNYWVVGEDVNGCKDSDTLIVAISISPSSIVSPPSPNDTLYLLLPQGGDIQFFANLSTNAISYDWDFGDAIGTDNVQNPIYTYTTPGLWTASLITTNGGCKDTAYIDIMVFNTNAVSDISSASSINLFPNPANSFISITIDQDNYNLLAIKVFNAVGKQVSSILKKSLEGVLLNTSRLPSGIYFLQLKIDDEVVVKQFSVSH